MRRIRTVVLLAIIAATLAMAAPARAGNPVGDLFYKVFGCGGRVPISCPGPVIW